MISRRATLQTLGAALAHGLVPRSARAQSTLGAKRLVVIHRPNGTLQAEWVKDAGGVPARGEVLRGFDSVWSHAVVPRGLEVIPNGGVGTHEAGMVTFLTGFPIGETRPQIDDDWKNTARSIDQLLLEKSPALRGTPIPSVHLAAHLLYDGPEISDRVLSYSGVDAPIFPDVDPPAAYARLFGTLLPGNGTTEPQLRRARARSRSVLDFLGRDLKRLSTALPPDERHRLDAHAAAIRELETTLDRKYAGTASACLPGEAPKASAVANHYLAVGEAAQSHFEIIRTAFRCDLTRVATFLFSPGTSRLAFEGLYPGMPLTNHHALSHQDVSLPEVARATAAIDRWYAEQTAQFIASLASTPDAINGGSLLDHTLVVYFSEIGAGDHSFKGIPVVLFGGSGVGLEGGRIVDVTGRSTNDLWLSIAHQFGVELEALGAPNQSLARLPGIFSP
jgi:hypothetical protein